MPRRQNRFGYGTSAVINFLLAIAGVVPAVAEQRDVRSCEVLENTSPSMSEIVTGPRAGEVVELRWVYTVIIQDGRVRTLLLEGDDAGESKGAKPSAYAFEPGQPGVSFRHDIHPNLSGIEVSVVERTEMFVNDRVVVETWRAWHGTKERRYQRRVLRCPSTGSG